MLHSHRHEQGLRPPRVPLAVGGIAISVLLHGAGWVPGQERCWQGVWAGLQDSGHTLPAEPAKASGVRGLALRKLPAKDCGGQPPLALH